MVSQCWAGDMPWRRGACGVRGAGCRDSPTETVCGVRGAAQGGARRRAGCDDGGCGTCLRARGSKEGPRSLTARGFQAGAVIRVSPAQHHHTITPSHHHRGRGNGWAVGEGEGVGGVGRGVGVHALTARGFQAGAVIRSSGEVGR